MENASSELTIFDQEMREERDFWVRKLTGQVKTSSLPLDHKRPQKYSDSLATFEFRLQNDLCERIDRLTGSSPFLMYTALMTALKICLYRYTGDSTVVIGTPARRLSEDAPQPPNALPVWDKLEEDISGRELLLTVRSTLLEAYARQRLPVARLIGELGLTAVQNKCPLFDVALAFQELHTDLPRVKNDLTITLQRRGPEMIATAAFNRDLFELATIKRFVGHFTNLLSELIDNTNAPIWALQMLTEVDRRQVLDDWNETRDDYPIDACIHDLLESHSELYPDRIAVVFQDEHLSYDELNCKADQLARLLQHLGVGPEVMVAVCLTRSIEMLVGTLAVCKAGGAFLPLDPLYPKERMALMLKDTKAPLVLTQERLMGGLPRLSANVICLDSDWGSLPGTGPLDCKIKPSPENTAYVIYTSGSTGRPKGVMVQHRSLCNLAEAQRRAFDVHSGSRVLQFASFSFDAAVSEFFVTLTAGATLLLAPQEALLPGHGLERLLLDESVTAMTIPPSVLALAQAVDFRALETLIVAGEPCPAELARKWSAGRRFLNAYGPTECTVCATVAQSTDENQKPAIGKPILNVGVYILDRRLQPVPAGVPGELHVGGAGVARGYLNHSDLTAEKFIPALFGCESGQRLYKTGDLARWLPDGNIEFIGRVDQQVKVRGYRIEPGEIEATLEQHPYVRQSVVIAREDITGDTRMVAYVVFDQPEREAIGELRSFLGSKLPEYMTPNIFVPIAALPLTPNGKVDRQALPTPDQERSESAATYVAPATPLEKKLTKIWSELLGVARISVHDHFFDLGGHSLLATQLVSRVREAFNAELPFRVFFSDAPTVAGLAKAIEQYQIEQSNVDEVMGELDALEGLSDDEVDALLSVDLEMAGS